MRKMPPQCVGDSIFELRREGGKNLPEMIAQLTVSDSYRAVIELLANSYDADATVVRIDRTPNKLIISDNGAGMSPVDLHGFYRLGDSAKLDEHLTPSGRRPMGKFGVATILLKYLGKKYELVTRKDDIESIIEEEFAERLSATDVIPVRSRNAEGRSGTRITIQQLNESDFSLEKLSEQIGFDMPLAPDFQVIVNNELVRPRHIENAKRFAIHESGDHMGQITGEIYYCNQPVKHSGVHVYVNKRRYGGPETFVRLADIGGKVASRVVAFVNADALSDAARFDRSGLRDNHPGVVELREALNDQMREVRRYAEWHERDHRRNTRPETHERIAQGLLERLTRKGIMSKGTMLRIEEDSSKPAAIYNRENQSLSVNINHPSIAFVTGKNNTGVERVLMGVLIDAAARAQFEDAANTPLSAYEARRHELWSRLEVAIPDVSVRREVFKTMLYEPSDLAYASGLSPHSIQYLLRTQRLPHADGNIRGADFLAVAPLLRDSIVLADFFQSHQKAKQATVEQLLAEGRAAPLVRNIGSEENPCYVVDAACKTHMASLFSELNGHSTSLNMERIAAYSDRFVRVQDLPHTLDRVNRSAAENAIQYASNKSLRLRMRSGQVHIGDFIATLQQMREAKYGA